MQELHSWWFIDYGDKTKQKLTVASSSGIYNDDGRWRKVTGPDQCPITLRPVDFYSNTVDTARYDVGCDCLWDNIEPIHIKACKFLKIGIILLYINWGNKCNMYLQSSKLWYDVTHNEDNKKPYSL